MNHIFPLLLDSKSLQDSSSSVLLFDPSPVVKSILPHYQSSPEAANQRSRCWRFDVKARLTRYASISFISTDSFILFLPQSHSYSSLLTMLPIDSSILFIKSWYSFTHLLFNLSPSSPQPLTPSSSPQTGKSHGLKAPSQIKGTLKFYTRTFYENTKLSWPEVEEVALSFLPVLKKYPDLLEEMQGVADGAGVPLASIIALNVRTEITYGLMKVC